MILDGKSIALKRKKILTEQFAQDFFQDRYMAILLLSEDPASMTYVKMKHKMGEEIGMSVHVYGKGSNISSYVHSSFHHGFNNLPNFELIDVLDCINHLNQDPHCLGIVIQLPLPEHLMALKSKILSSILPQKDVDGLGGTLVGLSQAGVIDFVPATPRAVLTLLEEYGLGPNPWQTVSILGQSSLIWKPLALELMKRGLTVMSFNDWSDPLFVKKTCQSSNIIISATWVVHLVKSDYIRSDMSQIIVDVGYGFLNGKPVWDVDPEIYDSVKAYSPVPGWVGPLTVVSIFENLLQLKSISL